MNNGLNVVPTIVMSKWKHGNDGVFIGDHDDLIENCVAIVSQLMERLDDAHRDVLAKELFPLVKNVNVKEESVMNNLVAIAKDVHENAIAHGWWEEDRFDDEVYALIHSEWSEALEEHRAGRPAFYEGEGGKPEGWGVEFIDGMIRIMDYAVKKGIEEKVLSFPDGVNDEEALPFPVAVNYLHNLTASANVTSFEDEFLHDVVESAIVTLLNAGVNWEELLLRKHKFNQSRPYKHGKQY